MLLVVRRTTKFLLSRAKHWNELAKDLQSIKDNKIFKKRLFNCILNE